jgi:hypothetical protein
MAKTHLEKRALNVLFNKVDTIMKYVEENNFTYPKDSQLFSGSIPPDLDTRESIIEYFEFEIGKINMLASKLDYWFGVYKRNQLSQEIIDVYRRDSYRNLTVGELQLAFNPINPDSQEPYVLKSVRNLINNTSMVMPVVRAGSAKYSPEDFERFLNEANIPYDQEISDRILSYLQGAPNTFTTSRIRYDMKHIRESILQIRSNK